MPSPLKNPAVTYMLIMLITVPLVSPCFWALVRCFLEVSETLKSRSANASVVTVWLLQCFLLRDEFQPALHFFYSQCPIHFGVLMTLCYSRGPFHLLHIHWCCHEWPHLQRAYILDNWNFHFPSIHSLHCSEGLVKWYIWKVTTMHLAAFRWRSQSVTRPGGLCASPLQAIPLFSLTFHLSSNLQVSPHEPNVQVSSYSTLPT